MKNPDNRRLLIVDDEPEIRRAYRTFLAPTAAVGVQSSRAPAAGTAPAAPPRAPFELVEAENGEQALEIFQSELAAGRRFAGAVVDVRMPGRLDGLQFIREAWKSDPELHVVIATAYQDRSVDEIDRLFSIQFQDQWDYLNKPFTSGEIIQKARQMVSAWNRRQRELAHLTKIEEQQTSLVAQEKLAAIGRLARSVGHEFGNVLQPLLTKLELTRRKSGEDLHPAFDEMIEATELGASICQDLLTFGREEHPSASAPPVEVRAVVERALRLLRHDLKKHGVQARTQIAPGTLVGAHEARLVQVFVNLMSNSVGAFQGRPAEGREIVVEARLEGAEVAVTVTDNGGGIPTDVRHLVFQPLFTTKGKHGNGLGLSVCRQIVEDYGGRISIEPVPAPAGGTRVSIRLPLAAET